MRHREGTALDAWKDYHGLPKDRFDQSMTTTAIRGNKEAPPVASTAEWKAEWTALTGAVRDSLDRATVRRPTPLRALLVDELADGPRTVADLVSATGRSNSTIAAALGAAEYAGVLRVVRAGRGRVPALWGLA